MGDFYGNNDAGGGFNASQGSQGGGMNASQGSRRKAQSQSMVPLTIKMVQDAKQEQPDDNFKIESRELTVVSLVGCIVSVEDTSTCINIVLEDGSGRLTVKNWIDSAEGEADVHAAQARATWVEGAYVHVIGNLRSFNETKHVVAFNIRRVDDFNQVTHHFLEAVYCHLKAQQAAAAPAPQFGAGAAASVQFGGAAAGGFNGDAQADFSQNNTAETTLQNMVVDCIKAMQNEFPDGVDVKKVQESLVQKGQNAAAITKAIAFLQDEGQLYSTTDDDHVKTTEW
jgi:replication factor A2